MKILGITANCGNDALEPEAIELVHKSMISQEVSLSVINLQEANLAQTLSHSQAYLDQYNATHKTNYQLKSSELMLTRTKLMSVNVLTGYTGIASFFIYDADKVELEVNSQSEARRSHPRFIAGTAANKGGLTTRITARDKLSGQSHQIQTNSGHLDSSNRQSRFQDWHNLKKNDAISASSWADLVQKIPDITISGYDANTRNRYLGNQAQKSWQQTVQTDVAPLFYCPLGREQFSQDSTYKTHIPNIDSLLDTSKRIGYCQGGSLDFVAIQNNTTSQCQPFTGDKLYTDSPINIKSSAQLNRDHNVIGSNAIEITQVSAFDKVKYYLSNQLQYAAPKLTQQLQQLDDTAQNRQKLFEVYQALLTPNGLLNQSILLSNENRAAKAPLELVDLDNLQPWLFISKQYEQMASIQKQLKGYLTSNQLNSAFDNCLASLNTLASHAIQGNYIADDLSNLQQQYKALKTAYQHASWWRMAWQITELDTDIVLPAQLNIPLKKPLERLSSTTAMTTTLKAENSALPTEPLPTAQSQPAKVERDSLAKTIQRLTANPDYQVSKPSAIANERAWQYQVKIPLAKDNSASMALTGKLAEQGQGQDQISYTQKNWSDEEVNKFATLIVEDLQWSNINLTSTGPNAINPLPMLINAVRELKSLGLKNQDIYIDDKPMAQYLTVEQIAETEEKDELGSLEEHRVLPK